MLRASQVAELTGVSVARLEHWRRSGLVVPSARNGSGKHWRYLEADVWRVRRVLELLGRGLSFPSIRRELERFHAEQSRRVRDSTT